MGKLLFLCLLASVLALTPLPAKSMKWRQYKSVFGKSYSTVGEEARRQAIFHENLEYAAAMNEAEGTDVYGMTPFMDETPEEFAKRLIQVPYIEPDKPRLATPRIAVPTAFDWRDHGRVTPVKDQASCGSCWAFSAVQNIEGLYAAAHPLTSFAPEQLVDCDIMNCGCFGGWPRVALQSLIDHTKGLLAPEADYPYCIPPLGRCYPCNTNTSYCPSSQYCNRTCEITPSPTRSARVTDWVRISKDEAAIQAELMTRGPLSVCLNAEWLQFYHHGVSDPAFCSPSGLNHAVLLVGWGVEDGLLGKVPYWIVKNSWGTKWGEKGYFRIIRGKGKCGINTEVISGVVA